MFYWPKCSLTRSVLFLGESCTSSVHIKTEEAALTLSRKQMFWLNFTLAVLFASLLLLFGHIDNIYKVEQDSLYFFS